MDRLLAPSLYPRNGRTRGRLRANPGSSRCSLARRPLAPRSRHRRGPAGRCRYVVAWMDARAASIDRASERVNDRTRDRDRARRSGAPTVLVRGAWAGGHGKQGRGPGLTRRRPLVPPLRGDRVGVSDLALGTDGAASMCPGRDPVAGTRCPPAPAPRSMCPRPAVFRHRGVQTPRCSDTAVFRHRGVQTPRCSDTAVFRHRGARSRRVSGRAEACGRRRRRSARWRIHGGCGSRRRGPESRRGGARRPRGGSAWPRRVRR
jgi:hypothetical protein